MGAFPCAAVCCFCSSRCPLVLEDFESAICIDKAVVELHALTLRLHSRDHSLRSLSRSRRVLGIRRRDRGVYFPVCHDRHVHRTQRRAKTGRKQRRAKTCTDIVTKRKDKQKGIARLKRGRDRAKREENSQHAPGDQYGIKREDQRMSQDTEQPDNTKYEGTLSNFANVNLQQNTQITLRELNYV